MKRRVLKNWVKWAKEKAQAATVFDIAKHGYQANFTVAIGICRFFFRCRNNVSPPDVEALMQKNILPVRKGRSDHRKIKPKSTVSFIYRVA